MPRIPAEKVLPFIALGNFRTLLLRLRFPIYLFRICPWYTLLSGDRIAYSFIIFFDMEPSYFVSKTSPGFVVIS